MNRLLLCIVAILLTIAQSVGAKDLFQAKPEASKARKFRLDYSVNITGIDKGAKVRVWLPEPPTNADQNVTVLRKKVPAEARTNTEPTYGNRITYFETNMRDLGSLSCQSSYRIERRELLGLPGERMGKPMMLSDAERQVLLSANKKIPLNGKSQQLLANLELPKDQLELGRIFYNRVDDLVRYDKSKPGYGTGDAEWVCDSRFGNCTDFHSLFIAWARAHGLPARFEIGFPLPDQRGGGEIPGYHCWAFFYVDGHGWTPVDISEADKNPAMKEYYFGHLTENRITFTTGRDIDLVPKQAGEPLNFFVYPYVEVNGKPLPKEEVKLTVTFADE